MKLSDIPANKFPIPFANAAGPSYITTIPEASQIGITAGAASLTDGFVPLNFQPVGSGGVPPRGVDFNGLLKQITQWSQWQNAGGLVPYDSTFSTAIGGYPKGAVLASASTAGLIFVSTIDDNTNNPDSVSTGWSRISLVSDVQSNVYNSGTIGGTANALTMTLTPAPASWAALVNAPIRGIITTTNTGAATLNVNGLGAKTININGSNGLLPGDLTAGAEVTFVYDGTNVQVSFQAAMLQNRANSKNYVLNPNFTVNPRNKTGSITLAANTYGHAMWKGGSSGATYSVAAGVATISSGSIVQVIEDPAISDPQLAALGVMTFGWIGTATVKINGGSAQSSPASFTHTSGAITVEVLTGTFSNPMFTIGTAPLAFVPREIQFEEQLLTRWIRTSFAKGVTPVAGAGIATSSAGTPTAIAPNPSATGQFIAATASFIGVSMASTPTVSLYNPNPTTASTLPSYAGDIVNGSGSSALQVTAAPSTTGINFIGNVSYSGTPNTLGIMWLATCEP